MADDDWTKIVNDMANHIVLSMRKHGSVDVMVGGTPGAELAGAWAAVKAKIYTSQKENRSDVSDKIRITLIETHKGETNELCESETGKFSTKHLDKLFNIIDRRSAINMSDHHDMLCRIAGKNATPEKPGVSEIITAGKTPATTEILAFAKAAGKIVTELAGPEIENVVAKEETKENVDEKKPVTQDVVETHPTPAPVETVTTNEPEKEEQSSETPLPQPIEETKTSHKTNTVTTETEQETQEEPTASTEPKTTEEPKSKPQLEPETTDEIETEPEAKTEKNADETTATDKDAQVDDSILNSKGTIVLVAKNGAWMAAVANQAVQIGEIDNDLPYETEIDPSTLGNAEYDRVLQTLVNMTKQDLAKVKLHDEKLHVTLNPETITGHLRTARLDTSLGDPTRSAAKHAEQTIQQPAHDISVPGLNQNGQSTKQHNVSGEQFE